MVYIIMYNIVYTIVQNGVSLTQLLRTVNFQLNRRVIIVIMFLFLCNALVIRIYKYNVFKVF